MYNYTNMIRRFCSECVERPRKHEGEGQTLELVWLMTTVVLVWNINSKRCSVQTKPIVHRLPTLPSAIPPAAPRPHPGPRGSCWLCWRTSWAAAATGSWRRGQGPPGGRRSSWRRWVRSATAGTAAPPAATGAGCPAGPAVSGSSGSAHTYGQEGQRHGVASIYAAAPCRRATWQRAEGNSSRQLWLRSRRSRCPSCCWTKPLSIKQDRESSSLPDRSSKRIFSLSLAGAAELSPEPKTEEEADQQVHADATNQQGLCICIKAVKLLDNSSIMH